MKVEVPVPPTRSCPATDRLCDGVVVPMPMLPVLVTIRVVLPVEEPMVKRSTPGNP